MYILTIYLLNSEYSLLLIFDNFIVQNVQNLKFIKLIINDVEQFLLFVKRLYWLSWE